MRLINVEDYPYQEHQIDYENGNEHFIYGLKTMQEWIDKQPTVDAEPVRHGRWIFGKTLNHDCMKCSECLHSQTPNSCFTYCPNCGAKMSKELNA